MRLRQILAMSLGLLMATLSIAGIGQAQGVTAVQGTIQAVDCQSNSLVLNTSDGATHVFPGGPHTAVFMNGAPVTLCALEQYIGSGASVTVGASGNQLVAERIDVLAGAAQTPPPAPAPAPAYTGVPSWLGVAIGSVVAGGLLYLLLRGHDGRPYNGYYGGGYSNGHYYQPGYYNGGHYSAAGNASGPYPGPGSNLQCWTWPQNCPETKNGN